jgi:hypothetical protein
VRDPGFGIQDSRAALLERIMTGSDLIHFVVYWMSTTTYISKKNSTRFHLGATIEPPKIFGSAESLLKINREFLQWVARGETHLKKRPKLE